MTMTDPIADMLTRVRNAHQGYKDNVEMPSSKQKESLAAILKAEGYIAGYETSDATDRPGQTLSIQLKYTPDHDLRSEADLQARSARLHQVRQCSQSLRRPGHRSIVHE